MAAWAGLCMCLPFPLHATINDGMPREILLQVAKMRIHTVSVARCIIFGSRDGRASFCGGLPQLAQAWCTAQSCSRGPTGANKSAPSKESGGTQTQVKGPKPRIDGEQHHHHHHVGSPVSGRAGLQCEHTAQPCQHQLMALTNRSSDQAFVDRKSVV